VNWRKGVVFGDAWRSRKSRVAVRSPDSVSGSEVGALLGIHGARKTKDGRRRRGKETVVKQAPGLGADERAACRDRLGIIVRS
jgi:hypothetical protein